MTGRLSERARFFAELLVGWPSVTNTPDEARFAFRLRDELAAWPTFRDAPADLVTVPAPGRHDRASLLALVRGQGPRTVLLVGHFDTVSVGDYADLAPLAGQPEPLRAALIERLTAEGGDPLALEDLASGRFLPGRGMLDMKSGLAAGLATLEASAGRERRAGNLLLIACPDEEETSAGMRSVAAMLPGFLAERGLDARLAINLDAINDTGDGSAGQVVAMGCIGKLLVSALVVGKEAHACYPLEGVNAAYLAAELVAEMEHAPELGEISDGQLVSPPTVLGARDLKAQYDVTLPARTWCFWNVLLHRRRPAEVLAAMTEIAGRALDRAAARMAERAARAGGPAPAAAWHTIPVLAYSALAAEAEARSPGFRDALSAFAADLGRRGDLDLPGRSRELTDFVWRCSGRSGPAVVFCFGATPYPAIAWREDAGLLAAIKTAIAAVTASGGTKVALQPFFPAIADMSFIGPTDAADLADIVLETPLWGPDMAWFDDGAPWGLPVINVGPWGRDYHHRLERTYVIYTFDVLPRLVAAIAQAVLDASPAELQ
ncbi:MAG: M20/M25/M40 family metallo-hydrolase [Rhodobacteraceae bacterium]|nr:M20/M25/M40 family metallo-hydrolase [Paracoccaceae bacterium]